MDDQNKIRFIRKHGRVIPIHEQAKGIGTVIAGAAATYGAGVARRRLVAAGVKNFKKVPMAIENVKRARFQLKLAPYVGNYGRLAGLALIGIGASKAISAGMKEKEVSAKSYAAGTFTAAVVGGALHAKGLGSAKKTFSIIGELSKKYFGRLKF